MILDKIVQAAYLRVEQSKKLVSAYEMRRKALKSPRPFIFEAALKQKDIAFICEVKKASPSKGVICENFRYLEIAKEYQEAGAHAISVLTEPEFFMGKIEYLEEIRELVSIPILQKDFIVDEYQIYEASLIRADAILLICAVLGLEKLTMFLRIADNLGISCLVEAHDANEIEMAVKAGARIIGVNNRNLKTMEVDIKNSINLRSAVPEGIIFVSESGIRTPNDINALRGILADAVLIGETLMRSGNIAGELARLRGLEPVMNSSPKLDYLARIKICGIRSFKDVEYVNETMPDYVGFVFAKSRRIVNFNRAYLLKSELNKQIKAVGVFVDEDIEFIRKCCECGVIDLVQLHGDEDEEYILKLQKTVYKPLIKAVRIKPPVNEKGMMNDFQTELSAGNDFQTKIPENIFKGADYYLFDTFDKSAKGGTGKSFNWQEIKKFKNPFFLAGGLNFDNIKEAIETAHPFCVDVSSGVETNGIKDRQKIIDIVNLVRSVK